MIDFRYHVVSLVSVFLALAVGLVLGAGPLKDPISNSIVRQLTQQRDNLKAERDAAQDGLKHRDDFLGEVSPELTGEQLGGRTVVLVLLPGADTGGLDSLTKALTGAGATVTGRVSVKGAWTDPAQRTFRDQLATQLQGALPGGLPSAGSTDQVLAALLARAVVTAELLSAGSPDSQGQSIIDGLKGGGLIGVDSFKGRATEALLIAAPGQASGAGPSPSPSGTAGIDAQVTLAQAMDAQSSGVVAQGPPSAATGSGLIAAIRGDDAVSAKVSTVDTGGTPMGNITTVLALREQLKGESGSYGFGEGADRGLPRPAQAPA